MDSVLSNEVARRIAADLATLVSEAEKHGTLPRIKSVAFYFNETELRTIIKLLRSCHGILDPAQSSQVRRATIAECISAIRGHYGFSDDEKSIAVAVLHALDAQNANLGTGSESATGPGQCNTPSPAREFSDGSLRSPADERGAPIAWDCADEAYREHAYKQMAIELQQLRACLRSSLSAGKESDWLAGKHGDTYRRLTAIRDGAQLAMPAAPAIVEALDSLLYSVSPQTVSEQLRSSGPAEKAASGTWTAGIDALRSYPFQDTQWHLHAIEFHHKVREEAEVLRDRWLALALSRPHGGTHE